MDKWTNGKAIKSGDYIDLRIVFNPELITGKNSKGEEFGYTQIYNNTTGMGRFAQGQIFGTDSQGNRVSIKITGKLLPAIKDRPKNTVSAEVL